MLPRLIVFLLVTLVTSQDTDTSDAVDYLKQFGYIPTSEDGTESIVDEGALNEAVQDFQTFAGLDPTGELNTETIELMKTPRCGKEDKVANFELQGSKWPKKFLTYRILSYPTARGISKSDVHRETRKAFDMWQEVSGLTFKKTKLKTADIKISFVKGSHGDGNPFNGRGGVLAHAFYPRFGGDAHFDDGEKWSIKPYVGTQILNTLTHEFGHSLGLKHSSVRGAIMAPFYKGWDTNLRLGQDDKKAIQALYGLPQEGRPTWPDTRPPTTKRPSTRPPTTKRPSTRPPMTKRPSTRPQTTRRPVAREHALCGSKLDAAVQTSDGVSYVFSGDKYWKLTNYTIAGGYPRKISSDWPGLPDNIDAAVTWQEQKVTYFFKGDQYWRFTDRSPSQGYPKDISNWSGLPANIDAAFAWGKSEDLFFFKGSQYWRYDTRQGKIDSIYPKSISTWKDVPKNIEAAFKWSNGKTYVFKSGDYWRLDNETEAVERSNPSFPRYAGQWWFGCPRKTFNIPLIDGTEDFDFEH